MQGIYWNGRRLATKKALKEAVQTTPGAVMLEGTDIGGREYSGSLNGAPAGKYYVVGPDPYVSRKWYAQLIVSAEGCKVK